MIECFKIQLLSFDNERNIFDIKKGKRIFTISCLKPYCNTNPTIIVADPFLFVRNDRLYLFYESKRLYTPGVLMMTSTTDLRLWTEPVTVLRESFHLSYPWVFEEKGKVYMVPETSADESIRLYEASNKELTKFRLVKKLLELPKDKTITMGYSDSSIYKKGDWYYLMTQLRYEEPVNVLELYVSNSLGGTYMQHPCSPIARDNQIGRNGGCWLRHGGKLLRVSQDCTYKYGNNVNVSEIIKLSPSEYEEKLLKESLFPVDIPFYKEGGHQFNTVKFKDKWIVATDAKEYHRLIGQRIIHKLKTKLFE